MSRREPTARRALIRRWFRRRPLRDRAAEGPRPTAADSLVDDPNANASTTDFTRVADYNDVRQILRRDTVFVTSGTTIECGQSRPLIPLQLQGDQHRQYRAVLEDLFSADAVEERSPEVRKIARDILNRKRGAVPVDFNREFSRRFPTAVFQSILGLQPGDEALLWTMRTRAMGVADSTTADRADAADLVYRYFGDQVRARRKNPTADLLTALTTYVMGDGSMLSDTDIVDISFLLLLASLDTVAHALSAGMALFASRPDLWEAVTSSDDMLSAGMEELLRWSSPARLLPRTASAPFQVGTQQFRDSDRVLCDIFRANRDPAVFDEPDEFDAARTVRPHLAFGSGHHRCVGIHLARLELRVAFQEIASAIESFSHSSRRSAVEPVDVRADHPLLLDLVHVRRNDSDVV